MGWSWLLSLIGVSWVLAAGRGYRWAWGLGLAAELVWMAYGYFSRQYGFIFGAAIYAAAHMRNLYVTRAAVGK